MLKFFTHKDFLYPQDKKDVHDRYPGKSWQESGKMFVPKQKVNEITVNAIFVCFVLLVMP